MKYLAILLAGALLFAPTRARAQDDESEQRLDDDQPRHHSSDSDSDSSSDDDAPRPKKHHRRGGDTTAEEELSEEPDPSMQKMAREDDPRLGLAFEAALSLDLIDKSYGPGTVNKGSFGLRASWAPMQVITLPEDEFWKYALRAELSWDHASYSDGTQMVNTSTTFNYIDLRGDIGYPVQDVFLLYATLGGGMVLENVTANVQGSSLPFSGAKFDLPIGLGGRVNFRIGDQVSIVSRLELVRHARGYMSDWFGTFTVGAAF